MNQDELGHHCVYRAPMQNMINNSNNNNNYKNKKDFIKFVPVIHITTLRTLELGVPIHDVINLKEERTKFIHQIKSLMLAKNLDFSRFEILSFFY